MYTYWLRDTWNCFKHWFLRYVKNCKDFSPDSASYVVMNFLVVAHIPFDMHLVGRILQNSAIGESMSDLLYILNISTCVN